DRERQRGDALTQDYAFGLLALGTPHGLRKRMAVAPDLHIEQRNALLRTPAVERFAAGALQFQACRAVTPASAFVDQRPQQVDLPARLEYGVVRRVEIAEA